MNTSGEAADQVVRMSMEVGEAALKITGAGAKQLAVLLYAVLKEQTKTRGRVKLENLVRSGKPLTVFSVKQSDLKLFIQEAKRYGIVYCAIRNTKGTKDGMVDIMVKEEDAPRINRIVERFRFASVTETAQVKTEIEKTREDKNERNVTNHDKEPELSKTRVEDNADEIKLAEELLAKPDKPEVIKEEQSRPNPSMAKTEKSHQSEPILQNQKKSGKDTSKPYNPVQPRRPSVKKELENIKSARKNEVGQTQPKVQIYPQHKQPQGKKNIKSRKPKVR